MTLKVYQLGLGQQGKRNIEKLYDLKREGYDVELAAISDINGDQFNKPMFKKKIDGVDKEFYLKDLEDVFQNIRIYNGRASDLMRETPDVDVVFDSTSTVWEGKDIHAENMAAFLEAKKNKPNAVYATEDMPTYAVMYAEEKPFTMSLGMTSELIRNFKQYGIHILENAVESFMPTKVASIKDIVENGYEIVRMDYVRMSATQEKSRNTKRLIIRDFGGSWYDKMPHDIVKFLQTYFARYSAHNAVPNIVDASFDVLEIRTPNKKVYIKRNGLFTDKIEDLYTLNESYAKATIKMGDADVHFTSSHLGVKPEDEAVIESWFTPEIKQAVAEAATKNGRARKAEDIRGVYGTNYKNAESRTERIVCRDRAGNEVVYLTQTFGNPIPSFFTAKVADGKVTVLQEGPSDGHKLFVKNALDVAMGNVDENKKKIEPAIHPDVITSENELLGQVDRIAKRDNIEVLDLTDPKNAEMAPFLKPELEKAGCW